MEIKVNDLSPLFGGKAVARARVVHRGKTVGPAECDVADGEGRPRPTPTTRSCASTTTLA